MKVGNSGSEMLALSTVTYGEYAKKILSVSDGMGGSREGEKWAGREPWCETNSRRRLQESARRELWPDTWILHRDSAPCTRCVKSS